MSKDLAFVYMSLLTDQISKNHGYEMFTDVRKYDSLLSANDSHAFSEQNVEYRFAQSQIEYLIPIGIKDIPLEQGRKTSAPQELLEITRAF